MRKGGVDKAKPRMNGTRDVNKQQQELDDLTVSEKLPAGGHRAMDNLRRTRAMETPCSQSHIAHVLLGVSKG